MRKAAHRTDADALLVRRTAIRVGLWITVAVSVLVIGVMVAAISFVFHQIPLTALFDRTRHEEAASPSDFSPSSSPEHSVSSPPAEQ